MLKKAILIILFALAFSLPVNAADGTYGYVYEISGADSLSDSLPDYAKEITEKFNIEESSNLSEKLTAENIFEIALDFIKSKGKRPLKMLVCCAVAIIVFAGVNALGGESYTPILHICTLSVFGEIIVEVCSLISAVADYLSALNTFSVAFVPVFATVLSLSGKSITAVKTMTPVLTAAAVTNLLGNYVVVPLMSAGTALTVVGSVSPAMPKSLGQSLKKAALIILSFGSAVFTGVVAMCGKISAAEDTVALKTVKVLASGVPYVGSTLGEMSSRVLASLNLLKSGVALYGVIAYFALMLPVLLQTVIWYVGILILKSLCELLRVKTVVPLLSGMENMLSLIMAVALLCGGIFIISTAVVMGL